MEKINSLNELNKKLIGRKEYHCIITENFRIDFERYKSKLNDCISKKELMEAIIHSNTEQEVVDKIVKILER